MESFTDHIGILSQSAAVPTLNEFTISLISDCVAGSKI